MAAVRTRSSLQTTNSGIIPSFCLSKTLIITGICLAILGVIGLWARLSPLPCICMVGVGLPMTLMGMYHDKTFLNQKQILAAVRANPHLAKHKENKLYYFPSNQILSTKKESVSEKPVTCLRIQDGSYHLKTDQLLAEGARKSVYLGYSCSLDQPDQVRSVEYDPPVNDELFIYNSLNTCPFIVHCLHVARDDEHKRILILEYCMHGTFHTAYQNFSQIEGLQVMHDYLEALEALHAIDFLHLDCHGGNLLLTQDNRGRLADFGSCRRISLLNTQEGFERFMPDKTGKYPLPIASRLLAPEIVACIQEFKQKEPLKTPISAKADLWSLGVTLADKLLPESEALKHIFACQAKYTHFSPFSLTPEQISSYLTELHHYPPPPLDSLNSLFWKMLHPNPQKRCITQEAKAIGKRLT